MPDDVEVPDDEEAPAPKNPGCLLYLMGMVMMLLYPLWFGYVVSLIWNWHIAGWHGLPVLGYATAAAASLIINLIRRKKKSSKVFMDYKLMDEATKAFYLKNAMGRFWADVADLTLPPLLVLGIAWLMV